MLRSALVRTTVLSLAALLAGCGEEATSPTTQAPPETPPVAAYVPPPLPEAPAAPWCARPAEATAFSVTALQSHLMVVAIKCDAQDKYNAFVSRFRPTLVAQSKMTDNYFSRNERRRWQQSHDDYITQLANAQSQRATVLGDQFCNVTLARFDEAMALSNPDALPDFAAAKADSIPQPMKFAECTSSGKPAKK